MFSGYLIRPDKDGGSSFSYISHTDPRGKLPPWFVNKLTHVFAPKVRDILLQGSTKTIK